MSSVLFYSSWHLAKEEVMVKTFTGSDILSEVWTRKSCVTLDLKAEYWSWLALLIHAEGGGMMYTFANDSRQAWRPPPPGVCRRSNNPPHVRSHPRSWGVDSDSCRQSAVIIPLTLFHMNLCRISSATRRFRFRLLRLGNQLLISGF